MTEKHPALGPGLATALVTGNMIGSGIFLLPASLGAFGSISLLGWVGAVIVAIIYAATFSCAALLMPASGRGIIPLIDQAFGKDTAFVSAALYWLQALLGNVAIALAVTGYLVVIVPPAGSQTGQLVTTLCVIWGFVALNLVGVRAVGRYEAIGLGFGLLPVLLVGSVGWLYFDPQIFAADWNVSGRPDHAVIPDLVILVLWAFLGLESASVAACVVDNPRRNVPLATIGGVLLAAVIYIAASAALMGIMPAADLAASTAPFADATTLLLGTAVGLFVALCAALKASGTLAGWILMTTNAAEALARIDRPRQDVAGRPPLKLLVLAGVLMSLVVMLTAEPSLASQFGVLVNSVVVLMLCFYAIVGVALVKVSRTGDRSLAAASRWFGAASAGVSVLIILAQNAATITAAVGLLIAFVVVRIGITRYRA